MHDNQGGAFMIMKMKNSRRKFLKRLGAMAGAAIIPGLAAEDVLAIPITTPPGAPTKKKAAPKKKVATKKKAAPKKKVVAKKKAAPKKKIVTYYDDPPYDLPHTPPSVDVPEPSTLGLASLGVAAIALATRHKKNGQEGKG
jgi:PEP-CTERM motif